MAVPAVGAKDKKAGGPTVRSFSPTKPELGGKLTLLGKGFAKKRSRNTVVLRAPNGGSTFLKPSSATKKKLVVRLRSTIERLMAEKSGVTAATRFRVRVLAGKKFGPWTKKKRSPVIQPSGSGSGGGADADCDGDGSPNGTDNDDDNDLLSDTVETQIKTDVCVDRHRQGRARGRLRVQVGARPERRRGPAAEHLAALPRQASLPEPAGSLGHRQGLRRRLPAARRGARALEVRHRRRASATRTLTPLYYSDGEQYSMNERGADGRRRPTLLADGYERGINFQNWAGANGYRTVMLDNGPPWYAHEARQRLRPVRLQP